MQASLKVLEKMRWLAYFVSQFDAGISNRCYQFCTTIWLNLQAAANQCIENWQKFYRVSYMQVQVQRRETERQIQNKLNSHAYISKLEAEEKWIDVDLSGVQAADSFWQKMSCGPQKEVDMSLSRKAYLSSLMPRENPLHHAFKSMHLSTKIQVLLPLNSLVDKDAWRSTKTTVPIDSIWESRLCIEQCKLWKVFEHIQAGSNRTYIVMLLYYGICICNSDIESVWRSRGQGPSCIR